MLANKVGFIKVKLNKILHSIEQKFAKIVWAFSGSFTTLNYFRVRACIFGFGPGLIGPLTTLQGRKDMIYKLSHEENDLRELNFLKQRSDIIPFPAKICNAPREIPAKKSFNVIQKLTQFMPEPQKRFWETLEVLESAVDLLTR